MKLNLDIHPFSLYSFIFLAGMLLGSLLKEFGIILFMMALLIPLSLEYTRYKNRQKEKEVSGS